MEKANDSTYNGQVYFMKGTDTIHTEKILLQQVEDSYNTTIKGQNDEPVSFILTDRNETQLVFENRKHNYHKKSATRRFQKTVW
jgi:lipopolysaccharide export system protein LptA